MVRSPDLTWRFYPSDEPWEKSMAAKKAPPSRADAIAATQRAMLVAQSRIGTHEACLDCGGDYVVESSRDTRCYWCLALEGARETVAKIEAAGRLVRVEGRALARKAQEDRMKPWWAVTASLWGSLLALALVLAHPQGVIPWALFTMLVLWPAWPIMYHLGCLAKIERTFALTREDLPELELDVWGQPVPRRRIPL